MMFFEEQHRYLQYMVVSFVPDVGNRLITISRSLDAAYLAFDTQVSLEPQFKTYLQERARVLKKYIPEK